MAEEKKCECEENQSEGKCCRGGGKKMRKVLLRVLVAGLAVSLLALATSPLWLGPLAKCIVNAKVPDMVGCEFKLEELSVNPFTGRVFLRDCSLKNPEGYKSAEAFSVSTVVVDVAVCSLLSGEIHVETIEVRKLFASYLSDSKGVNNIDRMLAHMDGKEPGAEPTKEEREAEEAKKSGSDDGLPKVVIDHFEMTDSKISYGIVRGTPPITLPLPSVTLDGIGKDGGVAFSDALSAIWNACLQVAGSAGEQVRKLGSAVGDAAGAAAGAVGDAAGAAASAVGDAAGAAADAVGGAVKSIGGFFSGDKGSKK